MLSSQRTKGKLLRHSESQFPHLNTGVTLAPTLCFVVRITKKDACDVIIGVPLISEGHGIQGYNCQAE